MVDYRKSNFIVNYIVMVTVYKNNGEADQESTDPPIQAEEQPKKSPEEIFSDDVSDIRVKEDGSGGNLSQFIRDFLLGLPKLEQKAVSIEEKTVEVRNTLGKLARVYERIRNAVEYKGEHVLRRNAIERVLKRLAWEQESIKANVDTDQMAEDLIKEMIWARYLENKSVPVSKIQDVGKVLNKYFYIIQNLDTIPKDKSVAQIRSWIFGIASSEVEEVLDKKERELYINLMQDWFEYFFKWDANGLKDSEQSTQIYLAIHRALVKSDEPIMRYHMLLRQFPEWRDSKRSDVNKFIQLFPSIYKSIEDKINYSGRIGLYRRIQRHTAAFEVLQELVENDTDDFYKTIQDVNKFEKKIREICKEKYGEIKEKVNRGIVRSIMYIFVTKVIFVLILEVPYEIFRLGEVRYIPLTMNIMLPPILMLIIGLSIRTPDEKNTEMIIDRLKTVVYKQKTIEKNSFNLHEVKARSRLMKFFGYFYSILFIAVFVGFGYMLTKVGFTLFGLLLFFVFLSLVLLFSFRIKYQASQMKVESEEKGFIAHFFDYITLPFLNVGFFLSKGLAKLNVFTIILDFLIEAPLKSIIDLSEEWTSFVQEKREDVVELPE